MVRVTYGAVYNTLYRKYCNNRRHAVYVGVRKGLKWHERVRQSNALLKILQTQDCLRNWLCSNGYDFAIVREQRLYEIGCMYRLRRLQRAILCFLWRPGGRLDDLNYRSLCHTLDLAT